MRMLDLKTLFLDTKFHRNSVNNKRQIYLKLEALKVLKSSFICQASKIEISNFKFNFLVKIL